MIRDPESCAGQPLNVHESRRFARGEQAGAPRPMSEPSPPRALLLAALIACGALALAACGQKGDLYLPDEPVEQVADDEDA